MESKKEKISQNKINILDEIPKKPIFESLMDGWDKDYKEDEIPQYLKEIRLAVIGNVDSGKSTLVGCLSKGIKDDGRGYARKYVFNFQHEVETGRTSSIAEEIIGFKNGKIVHSGRLTEKKNVSWKEIASQSDHVITFLDLCGHEKYLKTTMYGISALMPHYAIILIGTNMGVKRMTQEHLGIVISLGIPFFIVFTKVDIAPKEVKEKTVNKISSILRTGLKKIVFNVKSPNDAAFAAQNITSGNFVPIFQISTVLGEGMEDLQIFLSKLTPKFLNNEFSLLKTPKDKVEMLLDNAFNTKVGCIYSGVLVSGKIEINQKLLMGPTIEGEFKMVQIREIQFLRVPVKEIYCGNSCSLRLKSLDKNFELNTNNFRKGMVLLDPETKLEPTMEFEVEALIFHHSSTIKIGYQSVIHCHVIRQTCTIVQMNKDFLMAGDTGIIRFRFIKKPEFMHVGDTILFREGRTRGKGTILKIFPIDLNSLSKDKKSNSNKNQQSKSNQQNNINNININSNKKGKKKNFKNNNNKQNENQNQNKNQSKNIENKYPPIKKDG